MDDIQGKESNSPVQVKVSRLAIVAISLTFWGVLLLVASFIISMHTPKYLDSTKPLCDIVLNLSFIVLIPAMVLGFISYILIEISGGKITGKNFAIGSILISIFINILPAGMLLMLRSGHQINRKMVCGTNLSGLGKAILLYANDYDNNLPYYRGENISWGTSVTWDASTRKEAYGINEDGSGGSATISSYLYLLVKYTDVSPKSFICRGDKKMSEFKPEDYGVKGKSFTDFWDFGPEPWKHCSFSYQMPFGTNTLTTLSKPGMAVAADRNPWIPSRGWKVKDFNSFNPDGDKEDIKKGNTPTHYDFGQNVLYLDTHVDFVESPLCGINNDNIYTSWNGSDIRKGTPPQFGRQSASPTDALLVNDPPVTKP